MSLLQYNVGVQKHSVKNFGLNVIPTWQQNCKLFRYNWQWWLSVRKSWRSEQSTTMAGCMILRRWNMLFMLILSSLPMTKYLCNYYTFQKCFQNTIWTNFCKSFCSDLPPSASHSKDWKPGQAVQGLEDCLSPGDDQRGTIFQISNSNCICHTR